MKLVLLRLLVLIDCSLNWLLGGVITETLSSRAHRMRIKHQPYFWWLADVIDAIFFWQPNHCERIYKSELARGGALAWLGVKA